MSKRGLGKGLDALLGGGSGGSGASNTGGAAADTGGGSSDSAADKKIAINQLVAGKYQPREHFAAADINALADSIRQHGIIQPLVVRPLSAGRYEIVAGERRFRAAKLAGLAALPAVVRRLSDRDAQIYALVENLQRADLNPMEQAHGLSRLVQESGQSHAAVAEQVGLSRPAVSNLLRLLELAEAVQKLVLAGQLAMGQARALLALPKGRQAAAAKEVITRALNTRQTEQLVRRLLAGKRQKSEGQSAPTAETTDADTRRLEKELTRRLAMRVEFKHRKNGSGKLLLHYRSLDALDTVLAKLKK